MDKKSKKIELLKPIIINNTIGIIVFSLTFIFNDYIDVRLGDNRIDWRFFGVIFFFSIAASTIPNIVRLFRLDNDQ